MKSRIRSWFLLALAACLAPGPLTGCAHFVVLHDPLTASEHSDLGVVYESQGDLRLAAQQYHHALRLDPHRARTRVNLGNIEAARGRWHRAEQCYRRALSDSSSDADAMNNLAFALLQQGRRFDEARALAALAVASGGERESLYRATRDEIPPGPRRR